MLTNVLRFTPNDSLNSNRLFFAELLVSVEDYWEENLATIVWSFLEDLGSVC
jgi:hypothetical protein